MKNISILGSTGSIGTQALDVFDPKQENITALTTNKNGKLLEEQVRKYKPDIAVAYDESVARDLRVRLQDTNTKILAGQEGLIEAAAYKKNDMVLTAVMGMVGLLPTLAAIEQGHTIALANKETLVCAGELVMQAAEEKNVLIIPVDSEHSAIFQCLRGAEGNDVKRIILTASGGPFYGYTKEELMLVTKEQALKHPNWSMGAKITVDSATMMNKGLELIEAMWLYKLPPQSIDIVIHRQSIVHSMVEFFDHSMLAQLSEPDMRLPIQYAFTFPKRRLIATKSLDFSKWSTLTFAPPEETVFFALQLARKAAERKGTAGAILNGANEAAVALFLEGKLSFFEIPLLVEQAIEEVAYDRNITIDAVMQADQAARESVWRKVR